MKENIVHKPEASERPIYRVMVVDDNEASAKTLLWTMELLGHNAKMAHDGPSAIELAKTFEPHIVLLDIGLPGMDGYETCLQLRSIPALKNSLFVAQTGWGQKEHRERSKAAGFDHHLIKPIEMQVLQDILINSPKLNHSMISG